MFITMLKNQRITFCADLHQATAKSPFRMKLNPISTKWVVYDVERNTPVAAGMEKDEAEACVMFKANEYIYRAVQRGA